jgi:hypothetical protein
VNQDTLSNLGPIGLLLAQFIGVAVITLAATEYLPLLPAACPKPYRRRITAVIYVSGLSLVVYVLGIVQLPHLVIAEESKALELVIVAVLGFCALVLAHTAHEKFLASKDKGS